MYRKYWKPVLDFILSLSLLLLHFPLILIVFIINCLITRGKPFFIHQRPGMHEKPVKMIKFRTIISDNAYSDDDLHNVPRFSRFLRRTSLDELPQLINVLKGEMSIVGPRPLLTEYLLLYNHEQYRRLEVKPGITGWAQINGRNALTWQQRLKYDVHYVENLSFSLDLRILFSTVIKVLTTEGATHEGHILCPKFKGNISA